MSNMKFHNHDTIRHDSTFSLFDDICISIKTRLGGEWIFREACANTNAIGRRLNGFNKVKLIFLSDCAGNRFIFNLNIDY